MEKVTIIRELIQELWHGRQILANEENERFQSLRDTYEKLKELTERAKEDPDVSEEARESLEIELRESINKYVSFVLDIFPHLTHFEGGSWLCDTIGRKLCENTTSYDLSRLWLHNDGGSLYPIVQVHSGLFTTNLFAISIASAMRVASDIRVAFLNKKNLEG